MHKVQKLSATLLGAAIALTASNLVVGALSTAAGAANGTNGFAGAVTFLNNLGTYMLYLAIPGGILGLIAGGGMLMAGSPDGPKWIARTAVGVGVVLLSKGIVA